MVFTDKTEKGFETLIVNWLVNQNGYQQGTNEDYNKEYAIDETRLFRFLNDTQPKEMAKLGVNQSDQKKRQFLNRLSGEITRRGIIDVLRNGIKAYPADLILFYFTPTENNEHFQCYPPAALCYRRVKIGFGPLSVHQRPARHYHRAEEPFHRADDSRRRRTV